MSLDLRVMRGDEVSVHLDDLARLRIEVFREWPYLYDGDMAYERRYMARYRDAPDAVLVGAFDGDRLVGASTGTPMEDQTDDFAKSFASTHYDLGTVFYFAESVLSAPYRGLGTGHAFFDAREAHARALGRKFCTFCSVIRPDDHPLRPDDARSHDGFWRARGYQPVEGAIAQFDWRDVGMAEQTEKQLQFWIRAL